MPRCLPRARQNTARDAGLCNLQVTPLSVGVLVKAFPTLFPEPLRVDHAFEEDARPVLGVARIRVQRLLNREAGVEADAASQ